ncbi:hypothetical protein BDZ89DRAFT_1142933 [Hymenopellis radicata]|nr:hypothetical protein BDZ89DRAFT_1142933 [Hymenopellis radicata]
MPPSRQDPKPDSSQQPWPPGRLPRELMYGSPRLHDVIIITSVLADPSLISLCHLASENQNGSALKEAYFNMYNAATCVLAKMDSSPLPCTGPTSRPTRRIKQARTLPQVPASTEKRPIVSWTCPRYATESLFSGGGCMPSHNFGLLVSKKRDAGPLL